MTTSPNNKPTYRQLTTIYTLIILIHALFGGALIVFLLV
jgi:hypothetical protein